MVRPQDKGRGLGTYRSGKAFVEVLLNTNDDHECSENTQWQLQTNSDSTC